MARAKQADQDRGRKGTRGQRQDNRGLGIRTPEAASLQGARKIAALTDGQRALIQNLRDEIAHLKQEVDSLRGANLALDDEKHDLVEELRERNNEIMELGRERHQLQEQLGFVLAIADGIGGILRGAGVRKP
jgi:chromosome segregation ATPase